MVPTASVGSISSSSIVHDVITKLVSFLQNNLTDPRASRSHPDGTWVFPNFDERRVEFPIISIEHSGGRDEWLSIGTNQKHMVINIEMTVQSKSIKERDEIWDDIYNKMRIFWKTSDSEGDSLRSIGFSECVVIFAHNVNTMARYEEGHIHWKVAEFQLAYEAVD